MRGARRRPACSTQDRVQGGSAPGSGAKALRPYCRNRRFLPIWGPDPISPVRISRNQTSLVGQVLAGNVLLVVATVFAASAAANLNLRIQDQRWEFALLALTIVLILLVNITMLRRRFSPLEQLIEQIEAIDPAQPEDFAASADRLEE